jgi:hypothetical protein
MVLFTLQGLISFGSFRFALSLPHPGPGRSGSLDTQREGRWRVDKSSIPFLSPSAMSLSQSIAPTPFPGKKKPFLADKKGLR